MTDYTVDLVMDNNTATVILVIAALIFCAFIVWVARWWRS